MTLACSYSRTITIMEIGGTQGLLCPWLFAELQNQRPKFFP